MTPQLRPAQLQPVHTISYRGHILLRHLDNKDQVSRVLSFLYWLDQVDGGALLEPNIAAYKAWLQSDQRRSRNARGVYVPAAPLAPASTLAYLSSVRGRYYALLKDNALEDILEQRALDECQRLGIDPSPANIRAGVERAKSRLENAINPIHSSVKLTRKLDRPDDEHIRLRPEEARALIAAPKHNRRLTPLQAIRDTAMMALLVCTGIRDMELCSLDVDDLHQRYGGSPALHVRAGKGAVERLVPYGAYNPLVYVEKWLTLAEIRTGAVFRGIYKGGVKLRPGRITEDAIRDVLDRYPIEVEGRGRTSVNPHDLRRTYARLQHDAGMPLLAIQQNLGHSESKVTVGYIGNLSAGQRRAIAAFELPNIQWAEGLKTTG